jgi:MFS superfamily sulfate permease-like transporter
MLVISNRTLKLVTGADGEMPLRSGATIPGLLDNWSSETMGIDILAGIATAGLLIPEGMAYAGIAGWPPRVRLYAAMFGMFTTG